METPILLSRPEPIPGTRRRTLDFDLETVAAGYADPDWVPHIVTAWACSWVDEEDVYYRLLPVRFLHDVEERRRFLQPLLDHIDEADVLTGHNIRRYDLPVLAAECMKLNLPTVGSRLTQDTIRVPKSKGFKKGQDNLAVLLDVPLPKKALNWMEWQNAYGEADLGTVRERVVGDVLQHKLLRLRMMERGWLEAPRMWNG